MSSLAPSSSSPSSSKIHAFYDSHAIVIRLALYLTVLAVFLGTSINITDSKYVRVYRSTSIADSSEVPCARQLVSLTNKDQTECCDGLSAWGGVCSASADPINKVFSSTWSFAIPLMPFLLTLVFEWIYMLVCKNSSQPVRR
jgi:hypothetical protein